MGMDKKYGWAWFFVGLGSQLQVIASLSIAEIVALVWGPILLLKNYDQMRRDGVAGFLAMGFLLVVGCIIACIANQPMLPIIVIRGMAMTTIVMLAIPLAHHLIRKDPMGFRWMVLGAAFSSVICIFVFQRSVEVAINARGLSGANAVEGIMSGPLFWIQRLGAILNVPASGWYTKVPIAYSMVAPLFMAMFALTTSTSGRSAALGSLSSMALCFIGEKKRSSIKKINKYFGLYCIVAILALMLANLGYRIAATSGWMGEKSREKYEQQTKSGTGIVNLLVSGRAESFAGLMACADKPIVGWGPWAMDTGGYWLEFLNKYGDPEDYKIYYASEMRLGAGMIPCHSHITEFWLWYGIFGLLFWIYVLFVFLRFLKQDCAAVPQWYFWLACSIPSLTWHIFFSPFGSRVGIPFIVVACLMERAVRLGKFHLPISMEIEIQKLEHSKKGIFKR